MKIRKAAVADFERLQALYRAFSAELAAVAPDYYVEASQDFALFTGIVECPDADILIAEKDGVPVGAATVWVQERPLSPHVRFGRSLKISYLAVSDEAARDELIRAAEAEALSRGIDSLELSLHDKDASGSALYRAKGFTPEITTYVKKL